MCKYRYILSDPGVSTGSDCRTRAVFDDVLGHTGFSAADEVLP